jgi:hypothetical protein
MGSYDRLPEDYDGPAPEHVIICNSKWNGQDKHSHPARELVRLCFAAARDEKAGIEVWSCSWLMEGRYDDGSVFTYECGLPTRYDDTAQDGSYACDGGHDFVPAQARMAQGWDYAADEEEAILLARAGVRPVQMNGKPF